MKRPRSMLALLFSLLAIASCSRAGSSPAPSEPVRAIVVASNAPSLPATTDALPAMDVDGYHQLLIEMRGTPVVVNFWASWCEPCKAEAPMLAAAATRYADRVQFLGVDLLDDRAGGARFIAEHHIPYPNVFDVGGAIRTDVGSFGQPVTVFYDAQGGVAAKVDGQISQRELDANLDAIAP